MLAEIVFILDDIIGAVIPVIAGLALVAFFWGLAITLAQSDNAEKRNEGRMIMVWGLVALFVMVSVWGIVKVLQETFDIQSIGDCQAPQIGAGDPNCN
jgi:uncharacterized membrane protein YjfL (UPF0719 family)